MKNITFEKVWNDLSEVLTEGTVIFTLSMNHPNKIVYFSEEGIGVITKRSSPNSKLVPKWMFEIAINYLLEHGSLENKTLLNKLKVKRSSFVLAALSQLNYIDHQTGPLKICIN